jgi:starvation-inducible outer membrane lipoprotein
VNTNTTDDQFYPFIAVLSNGNFVVVWSSFGQDGSGWGIYGQVFTPDNSKVKGEFQVNTNTTDSQQEPRIAVLSNGNFVVVWSLELNYKTYGIYGQVFTPDISKVNREFKVNTYTLPSDYGCNPSIEVLSNGNFVVVWEGFGSGTDLFGQVFTPDNSKVNSEFQVNTNTTDIQDYPGIGALSNGNFVVVWQSYNLQVSPDYGVYGQVFSPDNSKLNGEFKVNTNSEIYLLSTPSIAVLSNGNFVVVWSGFFQNNSSSSFGVYGQIYYDPIVATFYPEKSIDVGGIVGGVAAGIAVLLAGFGLWIYSHRNKEGDPEKEDLGYVRGA